MAKQKNKLKRIDAPVYSYWDAFYLSFYSRQLYVDVGKRWQGLGAVYLLILLALLSIPYAMISANRFNTSFNEQIIDTLKQLPTVYVQNGQTIFDQPMPYLIKNSKKQVVIIVDTTGKVNDFSKEYPHLSILINKNKIALRLPTPHLLGINQDDKNSLPMIQSFDPDENLVFSGQKLLDENHIWHLKLLGEIIIYPVLVTILFCMFLIANLVFSFMGQIFSSVFFSFKIGFMQASRLLMVAATPMLVLLLVLMTFYLIFPGSALVLLGLLVGYFSFALRALKSESQRVVNL